MMFWAQEIPRAKHNKAEYTEGSENFSDGWGVEHKVEGKGGEAREGSILKGL